MKRFLQAAAVSCSLPLIQAGGGFKWNGHRARDGEEYVPAYETAMALNIQASAMGPAPTSPPKLMKGRFRSLGERQDANDQPGSVCGYIEGSSAYPYACAVTDSCLFTTASGTWVAGCCPSTSLDCSVATTCVDSTVWNTLSSIGIETYSCTSSEYPYCMTMTYGDFVGYSVMACAKVPQTADELIEHTPLSMTTSASDTPETTNQVDTAVESSAGGSSTSTSSTSSSSTSTPTPTVTPAPAAKSSLPIGAIVGGAVGGIAVIALLILGLVLILRKRSTRTAPAIQGVQAGAAPTTGAAPPPGEYQTHSPPMEQQWQQYPAPSSSPPPFHPAGVAGGGGGFVDNRISTQKPPYDIKTHQSVYDPNLSPSPGSPPPPSQQQHSPNLNYSQPAAASNGFLPGQGHGGQGVSPTEQQGFQQYQHNMSSYHELPVVRADGQLREMP